MSVSKLSATLQSKILDGLLANVKRDIESAQLVAPTLNLGTRSIQQTATAANAVRFLTNTRQTGIFGPEGLKDLADGFAKIATTRVVGTRILTKDGKISKRAGYTALKKYLEDIVKNYKGDDQLEAIKVEIGNLGNRANAVLVNPDLYNEFVAFLEKSIVITRASNGNIILPESEHGTINKLFYSYLKSKGTDEYLIDFISANIDAGHLLGIFNQKLLRGFNVGVQSDNFKLGELSVDILANMQNNTQEDIESVKELNKVFSSAFNMLEVIDYLSSSLKSSPSVFIKLSKEVYVDPENPRSAAEMQISIDNSEVGKLLASAGASLSNLIKTAENSSKLDNISDPKLQTTQQASQFATQLGGMFKKIGALADIAKSLGNNVETASNNTLKKYIDALLKKTDEFGEILLNAEGSDSVKTAIVKTGIAGLTGKKLPPPSASKVSAKQVAPKNTSSKSKVNAPKVNPLIKLATNITSNTKIAKPSISISKQQVPLVSLQQLINSKLRDTIISNMGKGTSTSILNNRTGRFASSAKVERMSQSREGMITAFYSYMKNPYATFSEGGRQESPRTRDPKLLISKSIREIAATQVANRMRAVST